MKTFKLAFSLLLSFTVLPINAAELISLDTRVGVQQKFILMKPEKPVASVILFAGGKGALNITSSSTINRGRRNFLVRSRELFLDKGFMVAVVDAPSDHQEKPWMFFGFRDSDEHVTDIDHVIKYLKEQANVPVWLVGTSRGTESAATIAIESKQKPHGLILTSSMTEENDKGSAITEMALEKITMPTLITAHEDDGCNKTPPEGAEEIKEMLTNVKKVEIKMFTGGDETGKPCRAMSFHGYLDIEEIVVDHISKFIKAN